MGDFPHQTAFRAGGERSAYHPRRRAKSAVGRKPWDKVLMFKVLVLQTLYNFADDSVEYLIRDRLSFMRFLGLGLQVRVPDAKTVWLYREALAKTGLTEALFADFDTHLKENGYLAMGGQIIDATIVPVPAGERLGRPAGETTAERSRRALDQKAWPVILRV